MADIGPRCNSSAHYVLMEDNTGLSGRSMTMPHAGTTQGSVKRTFSSPAHSTSAAADEERDVAPPLPSAPLQTSTKSGILRHSVASDGDINAAPRAPRPKKQVSISLPGSPWPIVTARRQQRENSELDATIAEEDEGAIVTSNSDGVRYRPDEVIVEVDIHDPTTDITVDNAAHVSAVGLLNGDPLGRSESSEHDLILLRDKSHHSSQWSSQRRSVRQSLSSSLSRIGNRMRRGKPAKLQRLQSTLDFDDLAQNELELKANIYWHIGTPIKRWKVEGHVPVKLILQLLKTLCLIVQVILFTRTIAHKRAEFFFDSRIVFESLFMVDFDPESVLQQQTLYSIQQVSNELEFIATNYYKLPDKLIGGYDHVRDENGEPVPIQFYLKQYREADLNVSESRYVLDGNVDEIYFNYSRSSYNNVTEQLFDISQDPNFHMFIELRVRFPVNVIRIEAPQKAECYRFNVMIVFEIDDHNGKILYYFRTNYDRIDDCRGEIIKDKITYDVIKGTLVVLDLIVLGFCLVSLVLTAKTLRRAFRLGKAMGHFYHHRLKLPLSWWERRSLFSSWHYINILSDLLIAAGTVYKILLEVEVVLDASVARILLGTALLFQAAVILRYLNYFRQVNALTRTLALAFPELVKFLLCGSVLFFAFSLCGWIVLGPFHPKFTTFNDTLETLFSLLNGDDIYNTYILLAPEVDLAAYIFSRFFLYIFLGLFVYAVLNLFTSLIISAHEISQNKDTAMGNEVRRFVFSGALTPRGAALRDVTSTDKYVDPSLILNKAQKKRKSSFSNDDDDDQ